MDSTIRFVGAFREWAEIFMHRSVSGLLQFAKERGLSMSQMGALFQLSRRGKRGVSDIGEDLGITSAAASQLLDRLVQNGLVSRDEDPHDRRAKRIILTERGHRTVRDSMEEQQRWYTTLAGTMTADERELAITALRILSTRTSVLDRPGNDCPRKEKTRQ